MKRLLLAATSGQLGPIRIGILQVTVASAGQLLVAAFDGGSGVSANLELRPIPPTTVALSEPGLGFALAAGALSLAARGLAEERRKRLCR